MKGESLFGGRRLLRRVGHALVAGLAVAGMGVMGGCLTRPLAPADPVTTVTEVNKLPTGNISKIDLLLMIDNSASMADKQQILAAAVPDLVGRLVNPRCVDANGAPAADQPTTPTAPCLQTTEKREFKPVKDVHIGIVTSSLGGRGSTTLCPANGTAKDCTNSATNHSNADMGHLIFRTNACDETALPTYNSLGFLAWDPESALSPPGETSTTGLVSSLTSMVTGVDQMGCGFEAQMEGWYRFLVDPNPYQTVTVDGSQSIVVSGTDDVVLAQRKAFLRPDSLLAIIALTDENDCSFRTELQYWVIGKTTEANGAAFNLWKPRQICETNPNDKCCGSCAQALKDCPVDPTCTVNGATATWDKANDSVNERCWETKRRFGIDFLYPISRYQTALTSPTVYDRTGQQVPNPIFSDLSGTGASVRDPSLVFVAYIVGVPWQLIARTDSTTGQPDLNAGFMNSTELKGNGVWDKILGDPDNYVRPTDLHMVESVVPRIGPNIGIPAGSGLAPVNAAAGTDPINGHEYTVGLATQAFDDLEYACIFDLPQSRDCTTQTPCDCAKENNDNPLCDADPTTGKRTLQTRAKAYPGLRELSLVKAMGDQGIVGSICPKQLKDTTANDYGYRPAIGSIIERLKSRLSGNCLSRQLNVKADGSVNCKVLEARSTAAGGTCDCTSAGHEPINGGNCTTDSDCSVGKCTGGKCENADAIIAELKTQQAVQYMQNPCFCEITALTGDPATTADNCAAPASELQACQCVAGDTVMYNNKAVDGWCYIDATSTPPIGNAEIVKDCQESEKKLIRFSNPAAFKPGSVLFVTCQSEATNW